MFFTSNYTCLKIQLILKFLPILTNYSGLAMQTDILRKREGQTKGWVTSVDGRKKTPKTHDKIFLSFPDYLNWLEHGATNTKVKGSIPVQTIH